MHLVQHVIIFYVNETHTEGIVGIYLNAAYLTVRKDTDVPIIGLYYICLNNTVLH